MGKTVPDVAKKEKNIQLLTELGESLYSQLERDKIPEIKITLRSTSNLVLDKVQGRYVLGKRQVSRKASSVTELRTLNQMVILCNFLMGVLSKREQVTARELYYSLNSVIKNGINYGFTNQDESNSLLKDLEVLFNCKKEDLGVVSEESGAAIFGPIKFYDNIDKVKVDCSLYSEGYTIPANPDKLSIKESEAKLILMIETHGSFRRVARTIKQGKAPTLQRMNPILLSTKGMPSRAVRMIANRLHKELKLPALMLTDNDLGGVRIFTVSKFGAAESAHLPELSIPELIHVNHPKDILKYNLPYTNMPAKRVTDFQRLSKDVRVRENPELLQRVEDFIAIKKEAEIEAMASKNLYFLAEEFLPKRVKEFT